MLQLIVFWEKTFFINSIFDFWGKVSPTKYRQKCQFHKKPFYMVTTTRKSFKKLNFEHLKCQKIDQWRKKQAHSWNVSTNFVLKKNIFYRFHSWFLGQSVVPKKYRQKCEFSQKTLLYGNDNHKKLWKSEF